MIVENRAYKPTLVGNPKPKNPQRCSRKAWCLAMERALETEANTGRKGLSVIAVMYRNKMMVVGVVFKKSPSDHGQMLNRCPWCGFHIRWKERLKRMERA